MLSVVIYSACAHQCGEVNSCVRSVGVCSDTRDLGRPHFSCTSTGSPPSVWPLQLLGDGYSQRAAGLLLSMLMEDRVGAPPTHVDRTFDYKWPSLWRIPLMIFTLNQHGGCGELICI